MNDKFIIIGCGISALSAVKAIREVNLDVEIHIFESEKYYAYNRIKLSKKLFEELDETSVLLQKKDWYQKNNVNLHLSEEAIGINTDKQEVILSNLNRVSYDKLLIATGARNTVPLVSGIENPGVFTLRGLDDAFDIHKNLKNVKSIVNIGAGSQGLETVWILHQHEKSITIIQRNKRLMPRDLDEKSAKLLKNIIEGYNINVMLNTQIENISTNEKVTCKLNNNEKLECDMVIYSAGISPNIEFLKSTSINTNKGIIVDKYMQTNLQNIYASGDVAEFKGRVTGLWNTAIEQGKIAGYNMVGKQTVYENSVPIITLNGFGISLFSMGQIEESVDLNSITEEDENSKTYKRLFIKNKKIIGAIVVGDTKKSPIIKAAIENETSLENFDLGKISIDVLLEQLKAKEKK